jgi:hypothetical protein
MSSWGGIVDLCLVHDFFVSFGGGRGRELLPLDEAKRDAVHLAVTRYASQVTRHANRQLHLAAAAVIDVDFGGRIGAGQHNFTCSS